MPELNEMTCKQCDEVFTKDELQLNDGYCDECAVGRCRVCREPLTEEQVELETMVCPKCEQEIEAAGEADEERLTPEEQRVLKAYHKHQEFMRDYNQRPHVKAKRAQYNRDRNKRNRMLINRLKEQGYIQKKDRKSTRL